MPTAWSTHLKTYAADNKITYKQAMSDPKSKEAYAKVKAALPAKEKKPRAKKVKEVKEEVAETPVNVIKRKSKSTVLDTEPQIFQAD